MPVVALFDNIRSLAFGGISGSYAVVGSVFAHNARIVILNNGTNGDVLFTTNNTVDQIFVPQGSHVILDLTANRDSQSTVLALATGTQFYVKQVTAPSSGSVYISVVYGKGE